MADLSNHEILNLAYSVGWRKAGDLERTLAIVLAESSGNPRAISYTGCCHGLWQINTNSTNKTPQQLYDPKTNAQEAFRLWTQRGWQPWDSSRLGQIARGPEARASTATWHLSPDIGGPPGTGIDPGKALENAIPGLEGLSQGLEKARAWLTTPANLGRLATGVIGAVIIIAGLVVLARPAVEQTIKTVSPLK
jgi:hypothetical protein